jgi:hypothetical protein
MPFFRRPERRSRRARPRRGVPRGEHLERRLALTVAADDDLDAFGRAVDLGHPQSMTCGCAGCAMPLPDAFVFSGSEPPAAAQFPLSQTFELQSRPLATKRIYLDFDGHVTAGTIWNQQPGVPPSLVTPAFSLDADYAAFSDLELTAIQEIWARVAEDYAPFDVDVTTRPPAENDLINSGGDDTRWGMRVVVGGDGDWMQGAAGVAFMNSFGRADLSPAFAFADQPWKTNFDFVSTVISHEAGHTLGLFHHGYQGQEYYGGRGDWGPLMGNPANRLLTQWSRGDYGGATKPAQDDLAIITTRPGNGFGYRPDDHGNTIASATTYVGADITGVIERSDDVDLFRFYTASQIVAAIAPASVGANLNILAEILNSSGSVIATSNPQDSLAASFEITVTAGTYYLRVQGTGQGDPATDGYSRYGSLGEYTVSLTIPPAVEITRPGSGTVGISGTEIRFTLSAAATDFTASDVSVTGGSLLNFSGSATSYTATFVPSPGFVGTGSIAVAAGVFTNAAGNPNLAGGPLQFQVDTVAPTVTVSRAGSGLLLVGGTAAITFQLSEPAASFGLANVTVAGGTLTNFQLVGTLATATFVPARQFRGTATIAVPAGGFTDLAGNGNPASNTLSIPVNTVAPAITEFRASPATARLRAGDSVVLEAGLSEPVTPGSGRFTLVLDSGGRVVMAIDPSGLTARGTYTVQLGEESPDLDVVEVVVTEPLVSAVGNPFDPSLPPAAAGLAARHAIVVDAGIKLVADGMFSTDPGMVPDAGGQYRQVPIRFSTPVTGVTPAAFALSLNGQPLSLVGAVLTGRSDAYELLLPVSRVNPIGIYTLSIRPGSGIRAVANGAEVSILTALRWGHQRSVGMAPAAPPALAAIDVIQTELRTSVVLGWSVPAGNGGGEVTGYEVAYRQLGTTQWYDLRDPVAVTATPRATISGVAAGGQYEFRVAARNAAGLGEYAVLTPFTVQVAAPLLTPVERAGSVTLATDGDGNLRANGALIGFNGGPANSGQLVAAGWTPVAAEADGGVNTVILRHTSGHLHFWRMDAGWRQVSGDGWLAPGSPRFSDTEVAFGVDLDGDGVIGANLTPIEQAGSVTLATDGGGNLRANGILISFNGGPANYGQLVAAGWTPVAAEVDGGVNTVILQHSSRHLHFWRMDAGWRQVGGDGWLAPGSPRFYDTETAFGVDLDGDRVIGLRLNLLKQAGGVALATDGGGNLRANGTLIRFKGGPVSHQAVVAAGWTPLAAGVAGGVNTVILQHTSGYLHFWRLDAGWQQVSGDGWVAPGSPQFFATEITFGVDLDCNLRVGS